MKHFYVAILAGLLAGCATAPSEYNKGCRDGILFGAGGPRAETDPAAKQFAELICDEAERMRQNERRIRGLENRR